ncbi:MAG: tetratricopeptide repeat protein [Candidatus Brocadiia bacterium]
MVHKICTLTLLSIFLLLTAFPALSEPEDPKPSQQKIEAARELYNIALDSLKSKQYEEARKLLVKAVEYNPDFAEAYAKLGDTYILLRDEELGYENHKKCLDIIGKSESTSDELAKLSEEIKRKSEKFRLLEDKITSVKKDFIAKVADLGNQSLADSDYFLAEELFSLIERIDTDNTDAADGLRQAREGQSNLDSAEPYEANSELSDVYYQSGLTAIKQNKYDEAIDKLNKAVSYRREFSQALFALGECHEKQKDKSSAIRNYRLCLKHIQKKDNLSKEESDTCNKAYKAVERLDERSRQMSKVKNDYANSLMALATDCFNRKYQRFACVILKQIDVIDPINRKADELYSKLDRKVVASVESGRNAGRVIKLFNGVSLDNWLGRGEYPGKWWSAKDGKMIFNPEEKNIPATMQYDGQIFDSYIASIKLFVEDFLFDEEGSIGLLVAYNPSKGAFQAFMSTNGRLNKGWNYIEVIKQGNSYQGSTNGIKSPTTRYLNPGDQPIIGIGTKNIRFYIASFTIQELAGSSGAQPAAARESTSEALRLFNGKDLTGWKVAGDNNEIYWKAEGGKLVVRPENPTITSGVFWQGSELPNNFAFSFDVTIEGKASENEQGVLGLIHESDGKKYAAIDLAKMLGNSGSYKISMARENGQYKLFVNGQLSRSIQPQHQYTILGLSSINFKASFSNITLKALK